MPANLCDWYALLWYIWAAAALHPYGIDDDMQAILVDLFSTLIFLFSILSIFVEWKQMQEEMLW